MRKGIERRQKNCRATAIEHAVGLMSTHGASYASQYLKNQKVAEEINARVLSNDPSARRALPRLDGNRSLWSDVDRARYFITVGERHNHHMLAGSSAIESEYKRNASIGADVRKVKLH